MGITAYTSLISRHAEVYTKTILVVTPISWETMRSHVMKDLARCISDENKSLHPRSRLLRGRSATLQSDFITRGRDMHTVHTMQSLKKPSPIHHVSRSGSPLLWYDDPYQGRYGLCTCHFIHSNGFYFRPRLSIRKTYQGASTTVMTSPHTHQEKHWKKVLTSNSQQISVARRMRQVTLIFQQYSLRQHCQLPIQDRGCNASTFAELVKTR